MGSRAAIDPIDLTMTIEAGVTLKAAQNAAAGDVEIDEDDLEAIDEIGRTVTDRLDSNPIMWNWAG